MLLVDAYRRLDGVLHEADLVPPHVVLDVDPHEVALDLRQGHVQPHRDSVIWVIVLYVQLGANVGRYEPGELCADHEEDEDYAADGDDGAESGGLCEILGDLSVDVKSLDVQHHFEREGSGSVLLLCCPVMRPFSATATAQVLSRRRALF